MHRVWIGLEPRQALMGFGTFVVGAVLVMHIWAFGQFGWPKSLKAKYNASAVASAVRAPPSSTAISPTISPARARRTVSSRPSKAQRITAVR